MAPLHFAKAGYKHTNHLRWLNLRLIRLILIVFIVSFFLAELINLSTPRLGPLYRYHLNPFSYHSQIEHFDFEDTVREEQCFDGIIKNTSSIQGALPNIVHMVMVVKEPDVDPRPGQLDFLNVLSIIAVRKVIQPDQIKLHYNWIDEENEWYQRVKDMITLVPHNLSDIKIIKPTWHPTHVADVMRLQILIDEGGIYIDRDIPTLRPFNKLLTGFRDTVLGFEGGARGGLGNAVIVSKKASPFLLRWLAKYDTLDDSVWNYHSVVLPNELAKQYPDELCELSPTAFFYPTWTDSHLDYMHTELSATEASVFIANMHTNGGAMYKNQLAYHMAHHRTHGAGLIKEITPDLIWRKETPFNILARQFLH